MLIIISNKKIINKKIKKKETLLKIEYKYSKKNNIHLELNFYNFFVSERVSLKLILSCGMMIFVTSFEILLIILF